ncbi:MAG: SPOR domain-containing protein [Pseudomonadota bacterium]|nr:SPOR domain-containing protein [Pseudomonadota bacterium]
MYCSECKLRIADDDVTVCPVCQGPLQPEMGNNEMFETRVSEVRIDDKFSAYESSDQDIDFNPEEFGLQSSDQRDPAAEEEDIRVLADLWEAEDVDADLEGVLAEAFSLDEVEKDIDVDFNKDVGKDIDVDDKPVEMIDAVELSFSFDDVDKGIGVNDKDVEMIDVVVDGDDKNIDVEELELNLDLGEDDLKLGQSEIKPTPPSLTASPRNRSPLLLLLLLVVVGAAGGAYWFHLQDFGAKPVARVIKPIPPSQSVKSVSPPPVEEQIVVKKVTSTEPVSGVVQETSGDQAAAIPVRDSAAIEAVDVKRKEIRTLPQEATKPVKAVVSQSSVEGHEMLVARKAEVLDKPVAELVKKSEAPTAPPGSAGEKTSVSAVKLAQDEPKVVAEIKPLEEAAPVAISKTEEPMVSPYAVHIGSFKSKKRASRQLAMLQKKGFAAYQVEVNLKGKGVWQRVLVPGGVTRKEAQTVQQKLADIFPREESLIRKNRR